MKLDIICKKVATECLAKPGTIVECMDDRNGFWSDILKIGKLYEVILGADTMLLLKSPNSDDDQKFISTRFRKAN